MNPEARPYYQSSSFKMAMLFTILLGFTVGILVYFGYYFSHGHLIGGTEAVIETEIRHFIADEQRGLVDDAIANLETRSDRVFYLSDANNVYIAGTLHAFPGTPSHLAEGTLLFEEKARMYAARIHTFPDGKRLLIGIDITDVNKNYRGMVWLSILSIVFMIAVIAISFFISVFVVSRTNRIARTAKDIMDTGNLSRRIEVDSRWDDLSYVGTVLNEFLSRVEHLVENVRQVSDNIAHDLRTPITRLRHDLEKLRDEDHSAPEKYETVIDEADRILSMFNALLRISNIDAGHEKQGFQKINLADIIKDVCDLYDPLADEKCITLISKIDNVWMTGDRDLLFQAFANLTDNAIKFTPAGGTVSLTLRPLGLCTITDTGPGIPPHDKDKIFRRFYRAEHSRHTPGSGLGLSLVEAVMRLHGAKISIENGAPGLIVRLQF